MNGLRNLDELAADDAAVEQAIEQEDGNALRLGSHAWVFHTDSLTPTDPDEEQTNRRALVLPAWFLPTTAALIAIIILAVSL